MADLDDFMPDPLASDQHFTRFNHLDLPELEDIELTDELYALRPLLWGLPTDHWLRERVQKLEAELSKRWGAPKSKATKRKKSKPAAGVKL
ncbi:hypothetical protein ES703_72224 [subsurface metagenome]